MAIRIAHASISENGTTSGKPGDQTGKEVCVRDFYNIQADFAAIHPDASVRERHAQAAEAGCKNDNIGYNWWSGTKTRNSLNDEAKKVGYDLAKVGPCNTDCSAFQNVCAVAAGTPGATYGTNGWTTSSMRAALTKLGYKIVTAKELLTSSAFCVRGAIYVREGHHTVCGLDNGASYKKMLQAAGLETEEKKPQQKPDTGEMTEAEMFAFFKAQGYTDAGAAGLMGNLYAESGLQANNLQNTGNKKLGMTDAEYTAAVDNGTYGNFVKDSQGYGLAQWTYWTRKQAFLDFMRAAGVSIGHKRKQCEFLVKELAGYKTVHQTLKTAKTVKEASDAVLVGFEKPADQSDTAKAKRAGYGQTYFDKYASGTATKPAGNTGDGAGTAAPKYKVGTVYTLQVDQLNVRKGAGTSYGKVTFANLTANAKANAYKDGTLKKGTKVTCKAIKTVGKDIWMQIPSGWVAAYYSGKTYIG